MPNDLTNQHRIFLSTDMAGRREMGLALAAVLVSVAFFVAAASFAKTPIAHVSAFVPAYQSALVLSDLLTAVLLFGQFKVLRSGSILVLASGYLFTAFIAVSHMLVFPEVFSPTGLLGAGPQSAPWLWTFWHCGFPPVVVCYALLERRERQGIPTAATRGPPLDGALFAILAGVATALAAASALTLLATADADLLPRLLRDGQFTLWGTIVSHAAWIVSFIALIVLSLRRPYTVLNLWLMVVVCAWLCDIGLSNIFSSARFNLGWYAGRIYGLLAASYLLVILLIESGRHFTRLAQMEGRYRRLLEAAPDAMVLLNGAGDIVLLNREAERQFGYHRNELLTQRAENIIPEGFAERLSDSLRSSQEALPHSIELGVELLGRRKDGSEFPVEITLSPLAGSEGVLVAIRDISARKEAETQLLAARVEIRQHELANRLKDEFVATVSHELRTPLTAIAGSLGLLIGNAAGHLPEAADRLLSIALRNSERLIRLINDILDIERIESDDMVFVNECVELRPIVEQAIEANGTLAARHGVQLRLATQPNALMASGDPNRLAQVFSNLLSNAIKFSSVGQEVLVAIENVNGRVRISVQDHGPGIPEAFKSRVFEKFAQADSSDAREKGGTGLGLSIVKKIVVRHGGNVDFADAPGGGTVFHVDLLRWNEVARASAGVTEVSLTSATAG